MAKTKFGAGSQFWALMIKNWIVKKRSWVSTMFEILLPTIVLSTLVLIHHFSEATDFPLSLRLGEFKFDFSTMTTVGLLLTRLNHYRTAVAFVPASEFPDLNLIQAPSR